MPSLQIAEPIEQSFPAELLDSRKVDEITRVVFQNSSRAEGELTVLITDDDHIQQLNRDFLETDAPTDVLAFPAGYTDPDSDATYLGDVIVSYPRAIDQAAAGGHSIEQELQLLIVHGLLHLMGYDHMEDDQKAEMWKVQAKVLKQLGNTLSPP